MIDECTSRANTKLQKNIVTHLSCWDMFWESIVGMKQQSHALPILHLVDIHENEDLGSSSPG